MKRLREEGPGGDVLNPWLPQGPQKTASPSAEEDAAWAPAGPVAPQAGVIAPAADRQLAVTDQEVSQELWWLGVHGGAGESALSALTPTWGGARRSWPAHTDDTTAPVVLVTRSHATGLLAAQDAMRQWAAGLVPSVTLLGLVVIADAPGRLPRVLREQVQVLRGGVPHTWHIPWIEAWRTTTPDLTSAPRGVHTLLADLRRATSF